MPWVMLAIAVIAILVGLAIKASVVRHKVLPGQVGLLYRNEKFVTLLEPGTATKFDPFKVERVVRVSIVPTAMSPSQYDVISKDQFAFRLMVAPFITITEPREFNEGTPPIEDHFPGASASPEFRFTRLDAVLSANLIEAVAQKSLEEFIADPMEALKGVEAEVAKVLPGTRLDRLALTSITLPPEVRKMFTEVERARREGLASLERAKAEQASLRALANAARNLANNPELAKLRVLQTMESAKGAKTFILGKDEGAE